MKQPSAEENVTLIVTGDKFICKKNVIMSGLSEGTVAYVRGREYLSECDGCITDEQGTRMHWWSDTNNGDVVPDFKKYFKPIKEQPLSESQATISTLTEEVNKLTEALREIKGFLDIEGYVDDMAIAKIIDNALNKSK